ncbi:hypothetical protein CHK_1192 [Christensenella hongkongensis]|uniref:Uncharacterized protein n=1 Tax=Christensenella hongkongensis TaxID=270498 RepID=A0A0M2NFU5_9FIRM|nr:hypothetical protein CHK_1192 [Christensenella hongkongensis]
MIDIRVTRTVMVKISFIRSVFANPFNNYARKRQCKRNYVTQPGIDFHSLWQTRCSV